MTNVYEAEHLCDGFFVQIFDEDSAGSGFREVVRKHGVENVGLLRQHELVAAELASAANQGQVRILHVVEEPVGSQAAGRIRNSTYFLVVSQRDRDTGQVIIALDYKSLMAPRTSRKSSYQSGDSFTD